MNKDLTVGSPGRSLIMFTIPLFISVMFQQMYNIADSVIAGKFAGEDALAAIGASYPITMIFMAVAVGCQIGCSVVISKHFGAGNMPMTKTCISTALISGTVLSAVLTVVGVLFSGVFMQWVQTPDNIFDDGCLYLMIYTGGFVFLFIYNVVTGIFNSLGDSKTPLYLLIGSSIGNVILDCIFIIPLQMGVAGAAWATFIAQGAAPARAVPAAAPREIHEHFRRQAVQRSRPRRYMQGRSPQRASAELHLRRQPVHSVYGQRLRLLRHRRRLLRGN